MPNRAAPPLPLREGDAEVLQRLTRSSSVRAGLAQRARIVLLASEGASNTAIAERVGTTRTTVVGWRNRYAEDGIAGLNDEARSGRPRLVDHAAIVSATSSLAQFLDDLGTNAAQRDLVVIADGLIGAAVCTDFVAAADIATLGAATGAEALCALAGEGTSALGGAIYDALYAAQ